MTLTSVQHKILEKLLDRYENSKTYAGENRMKQNFRVRPEEVWSGYGDNFTDIAAVEDFERQAAELDASGFLSIRRDKRGEILAFQANLDRIADYYVVLGRREKRELQTEEMRMYQEHEEDATALGEFCREQIRRLKGGKRPEYQPERARHYILLLDEILRNDRDLYERELSVRVLHDTKLFEQSYRRTVCKILRKYGEYETLFLGETEERVIQMILLESHHIFANPGYVFFKGNAIFRMDQGGEIAIEEPMPLALSADFLDRVTSIWTGERRILTIENLTSFHRFSEPGFFCIYLAGYHSRRKTSFLKKIEAPEEKEWLHFGDMDPDGFMILRNLISKTGLPFAPYRMDIDTQRQFAEYAKPLEASDRSKADTLIAAEFYPDILRFMVKENRKLEQEILSSVCS